LCFGNVANACGFIFLKLFEGVYMDRSFPMSRFM
jgi:hypothetical protein